jgi:hypothetical protein
VTFTCPNGHASSSDDYCDQCGIRLGQATVAPATPIEENAGTAGLEQPLSSACPACGDGTEPGARYCESCGTDLANPAPAPVRAPEPTPPSSEAVPLEWQLLAVCDPGYFSRVEVDSLEFPAAAPDRMFRLTGDRVAIGRHGELRPGEQSVDLSEAPSDTGISHRHALLVHQSDGGWTIVDCHSTNGTFLNDDSDPIPCDEPVALREGDRLHLGAWTTITLLAVPK